MIKKFIKKHYLKFIIVLIIILYYYYKKPIVVKPLYSDDSGFYITLQYELKEDYQLGDDMGKLFGKHSRATLLDTGSMWIDIGSVMGKHDKKIFEKRLDNLEKVGARITYLDVDDNGKLDTSLLEDSIGSDTILVALMHVNNETGVIADIGDIGTICKKHNVLFFTDATQTKILCGT